MGKMRGNKYKLLLGRFQLEHKRKIFHNESNQPLEWSLQGSGGFPNIGYFYDSAGQYAGTSSLGYVCLERLYQVIFENPSSLLFYNSMITSKRIICCLVTPLVWRLWMLAVTQPMCVLYSKEKKVCFCSYILKNSCGGLTLVCMCVWTLSDFWNPVVDQLISLLLL